MNPRKFVKLNKQKGMKRGTSIELVQKVDEYFLYNHNGLKTGTTEGIKISPDQSHTVLVD